MELFFRKVKIILVAASRLYICVTYALLVFGVLTVSVLDTYQARYHYKGLVELWLLEGGIETLAVLLAFACTIIAFTFKNGKLGCYGIGLTLILFIGFEYFKMLCT